MVVGNYATILTQSAQNFTKWEDHLTLFSYAYVVYIIKGVLFHSIFNHLHVLLALTFSKLITELTGSSDQSDVMRP